MRVLLQRVSEGSVVVEGETVGAIGAGYVLLVGPVGETPPLSWDGVFLESNS